ncbi:MAG: RNA methyltransferase [Candidatus Magasanikbacteria bacterium]|nr:RNA methyltransferase [Candidatus Magasanikbacteria bacterium]
MLSKVKEKLLKSLQTKKGRLKSNLCLVEGKKVIETAGKAVEFTFTNNDTDNFKDFTSTQTPQNIAGIAKIPKWNLDDIKKYKIVVVLDGIQDPGNLGSIFRLCLGFNASLILVESVDPTNPKVIRSSVGALFQVPWIETKRIEIEKLLEDLNRPIYKLEKGESKILNSDLIEKMEKEITLIVGSEGQGIKIKTKGTSIEIKHNEKLESLNVGHALAIILNSLK